ncbi:MAG: GAF domain-containing protein, partial [Myxococcota bacterium]|nr:GAF domain-containing protein [Myxococcota bacterium]
MSEPVLNIDRALESILRGAAKVLGCDSANMLVFDTEQRLIRVRVGTAADRLEQLAEIESIMGGSLRGSGFAFELVCGSPLFSAWHEQRLFESSQLAELVATVFPAEALEEIDTLLGDHRYICVPVVGRLRNHGLIIFEKANRFPFSPQQREVLIRYARRVSEILDEQLDADTHPYWQKQAPREAGPDASLPNEHGAQRHASTEAERTACPQCGAWTTHGPESLGDDARPLQAWESPIFLQQRARCARFQQKLLQLALLDSPAVLTLGPDARITSCNAVLAGLLERHPEELLGQDIGIIFPQSAEIHAILNHQFLFVSEGFYEQNVVLEGPHCRLACRLTALLLAGEDNQVIGFLLILRDPQPALETPIADEV